MRQRLGDWMVRQGWHLRYRHLAADARPPYAQPSPWQQWASMKLVDYGERIRGRWLLVSWVQWWKALAYVLIVGCIPLTIKDRLKRRIRGW